MCFIIMDNGFLPLAPLEKGLMHAHVNAHGVCICCYRSMYTPLPAHIPAHLCVVNAAASAPRLCGRTYVPPHTQTAQKCTCICIMYNACRLLEWRKMPLY